MTAQRIVNILIASFVLIFSLHCDGRAYTPRGPRRVRSLAGDGNSQPSATMQSHSHRFEIMAIADLDKKSRVSNSEDSRESCPPAEWKSYVITASLYLNFNESNLSDGNITLEWDEDEPEVLKGHLGSGGRGMELSELIQFDGKLLTCDDRTGILYKISKADKQKSREWRLVPWIILPDGDGNSVRGFKCEWATVKNGNLWVGSIGRSKYRFVKEVTKDGQVRHHNWTANYQKMDEAIGIQKSGYLTHEAGGWSDFHQRWVFIPRKISFTKYVAKEDEMKGANKIILADENFENIELRGMAGELMPTRGVSSFKWLPLPSTNSSYIIAIKTEELNEGNDQATSILAFDLDGRVLLQETKIDENKYEGLEFI